MFLSLVLHNHQPVGQLPWAFENAWRDSYAPFLGVLERHPKIKVALHFSGPLLDWLLENKPETIAQIRVLAQRNQVEILGGGHYEPILAIWPHDDQVAQLRKLSARVQQIFGHKPRGMWLAERVWEPQLAVPILQSGLEYTFVDGTVFEAANVRVADSFDVFQVAPRQDSAFAQKQNAPQNSAIEYSNREKTPDSAAKLAIFPINQTLRQMIPWHDASETLDFLRGVREHKGDDAIVVFADDGEKFGGWPGTFDFVYTRGWLEHFFTLLEENSSWLQTATPSEILDARSGAARSSDTRSSDTRSSDATNTQSSARNALREVDLPSGSYAEMQDWSGGNWRHFLQKYHESRDICDEVLRVREIVSSRAAQNSKAEKTPYEREIEREKIARATDLVLQAQSNDPLWHGAFGGLYLRHLRQALYAKTTEAQLLVDPETPFARVQCEKNGDWTLENELMRIGVRALGGQISNWTSKAARHNLLSTLRRYREPYYAPNAPEDWHARAALLDHFLGDATTIESFAQSKFSEQGDFVSELWQIETRCGALTASVSDSASVSLRREGGVWFGGVHQPLSICKTLTLRAASDRVEIEYSIRNNSDVKLDIWWANEWNIALSGTDAPTRHFHGDDHKKQHRLDENAQFQEVSSPVAADDWLRLRVQWNFKPNPALWHVPIWSVSQREDGETERSHQSSAFVFHRRLHLMPKTEHLWKFTAGLH